MKSRKEVFNELAKNWDEMAEFDSVKTEKIINVIEKTLIDKNDIILDVGCGTGILIDFLISKINNNGRIVAIDIAEKMIEVARKKYHSILNVDFVANDVLEYNFDHSFDKVIIFSAFPHFDDKTKCLNTFFNLLKNHGKLIIFHLHGSKKINEFHSKLQNEALNKDYLPSIDEMLLIINKKQWDILDAIDNEELYLLILQKK